jgi:SpoIID/LytB domain protein
MRRLGGLVIAGLLTVVPAAPAVADDPYDVPDQATITVTGDGSGHGKGLSQYGAYGAANDGLDAGQILDFYYPGTERGTRGGAVEVWISRDDGRHLVVEDRTKLMVRAGTGRLMKAHAIQPKADKWRITPTAEGAKVFFHRGTWRLFQSFRGDVAFFAGGAPITLRTPDGPVDYRGELRSTTHDGDRITVNVLPLDRYIRGVVPAELSSLWPQQAMRAQAVASRTYAAYEREHAGARPYDLCDTAACQAYGGASAETAKSDEAVAATAKQVLTFGGETAFAQYSASNGGWTVDGGYPYLPAQQDPYEGASPDYYGWTVTVTSKQIENAYNLGNLTYLGIETRDGQGPRGGRVQVVRIKTEGGFDGTVTGDSFRRNLGLRSTLFEITRVS